MTIASRETEPSPPRVLAPSGDPVARWLSPRFVVPVLVAAGDAWHESVIDYLHESAAPDEEILVYGHEAHYYFLAGRYSSWPFVQLYPGQAGGDGGQAWRLACAGLRLPSS